MRDKNKFSKTDETLLKSFLKIISKKRKVQLFINILLMTLAAFFESVTITLLGPYLEILVSKNNQDLLGNPFLFFSVDYTNNKNELIIYSSIIFIIFIFISGSIRILNNFVVTKLSAEIGAELSTYTYRKSLNKNYEYHISTNSSYLISSIVKYIDQSVFTINAFQNLIVSVLICISIIVVLFFKYPIVTPSLAFLFLIFYLIIINKVKPILNRNSKIYNTLLNKQIKFLKESLGSIREIKLSSNYKLYIANHRKIDRDMRLKLANNSFINQSPRYLLESVGLSFVIIFCIFLRFNNESIDLLFTSIATISLGALRLLISMNQVYGYLTTIRINKNGLKRIIQQLNDNENEIDIKSNKNKQGSKQILTNSKFSIFFKDVDFAFQSKKKLLFEKINITIKSGDKVGIKGTSGVGKTTFVDLLVGLLKPKSGKILINGYDINLLENNNLLVSWQNQISYVPQTPYLIDDSIIKNIAIGINEKAIDIDRVKEVAKIAQLDDFINSLEFGLNTIVGESGFTISGGQRQRLAIARALYRKTNILVMDEATSSLDEQIESNLIKSIENYSKDITLLMIAHRISTLKNCNKIFTFENNQIKVSNREI